MYERKIQTPNEYKSVRTKIRFIVLLILTIMPFICTFHTVLIHFHEIFIVDCYFVCHERAFACLMQIYFIIMCIYSHCGFYVIFVFGITDQFYTFNSYIDYILLQGSLKNYCNKAKFYNFPYKNMPTRKEYPYGSKH